jgi:uncharacterized membrane protein
MSTAPQRVVFVDLVRAAAVLFMIQGHTLQVLLGPGHQSGPFFNTWLFLRGLTSCAFLMLSGFSFSLATDRHWDAYRADTPRLRRRLARFGAFLLLGYAMRIPTRPLSHLWQSSHAQWQAFSQVDILQLVAVTLALLQAATWLARSRRGLAVSALGAAGLVVAATPLLWRADRTTGLPLWVASYLSDRTGSLFPLFPWAAYILFGAAAGLWFVARRERSGGAAVAFLVGGLGMLAAGLVSQSVPLAPYGPIDFWRVSPSLFLVKSGSVLVLLSAAVWLTRAWTAVPRLVSVLSRESLTVYLVHLCILYGSIWNDGLVQVIGPHLGVAATAGWAAFLVVAMSLLAWTWHECKQRSGGLSAAIRAVVTVGLVYAIT